MEIWGTGFDKADDSSPSAEYKHVLVEQHNCKSIINRISRSLSLGTTTRHFEYSRRYHSNSQLSSLCATRASNSPPCTTDTYFPTNSCRNRVGREESRNVVRNAEVTMLRETGEESFRHVVVGMIWISAIPSLRIHYYGARTKTISRLRSRLIILQTRRRQWHIQQHRQQLERVIHPPIPDADRRVTSVSNDGQLLHRRSPLNPASDVQTPRWLMWWMYSSASKDHG